MKRFFGTDRILTEECNPDDIDLVSHYRFLKTMVGPEGGFLGRDLEAVRADFNLRPGANQRRLVANSSTGLRVAGSTWQDSFGSRSTDTNSFSVFLQVDADSTGRRKPVNAHWKYRAAWLSPQRLTVG